jgi:hypothetical protein
MVTKDLKVPQVGEYVRHNGKLVAIEDVTPPQPPKEIDYIFEEIEAKVEVLYGDEIYNHLETISDFYGYETCINEATQDAKEYARKRHITKESDLELRVTKVVTQYRKRPINRENIYDEQFQSFDYKEKGSQYNLPEPIETIVWSSKDKTG